MSSRPFTRLAAAAPLWAALVVLAVGSSSAHAQLELTVHGGIHAARLDRPERTLEQPARGISLQSAAGEATAFGLRASGPLSLHWRWDGGLLWSRNRSAFGSVGPRVPDFETHTIFITASLQALLTSTEARLSLRAGLGPALILHQGSGSSLLTRQADVGGMLNLLSEYSLDGRLAIRLDAQEYLFSSSFSEPYAGQFVGEPVRPAGSQFRHEFVLLAGLSWLTH